MPNLILSFVLLGLLLITGGYFFAQILRRLDKVQDRLTSIETTLDHTYSMLGFTHSATIEIRQLLTPEPGLKTIVTIAETPQGIKPTSAVSRVPRDMGEEARQARDKDRVRVYPDGYTEIRREE